VGTKKSDIREVHKYAELINAKIEADENLKAINARISELTPAVLDYFQRQGIDQIAASGRTLYLRRELHTNRNPEVSTEDACGKLESVGLGEYVGAKINIQGLSAHIRELELDGQDINLIEEQFGGAFSVREIFKIGSRKR
jgi:hypothetical protein